VGIALKGAQASERPKWTTRGWNTPGLSAVANVAPTEDASNLLSAAEVGDPDIKVGDTNSGVRDEDLPPMQAADKSSPIAVMTEDAPVKHEDTIVKTEGAELVSATTITTGMFRKRKMPAASAGSRVRR
jgi:hypothetical protein